jgi:hypothetical protein
MSDSDSRWVPLITWPRVYRGIDWGVSRPMSVLVLGDYRCLVYHPPGKAFAGRYSPKEYVHPRLRIHITDNPLEYEELDIKETSGRRILTHAVLDSCSDKIDETFGDGTTEIIKSKFDNRWRRPLVTLLVSERGGWRDE